MSYTLHAGPACLLASEGRVIRAADAQHVADAAALLEQAELVLAEAKAEADRRRIEGGREGFREAAAEVKAEAGAALAAMARDLAASSARRDEELAAAAMAAVKAMLGEAAPEVIGPALVRQAIASFAESGPVEVIVAPELAPHVRAALAGDPRIAVVEDARAAPLYCELRLPSGTIRAGMEVQLQALAERWGLPPEQAA